MAAVTELLEPYDAQLMRCYPEGSRVNNVGHDEEDCSRPMEIADNQQRLFV